ncbi:hypothetical protein MKW92_045593 [Papaver armeniacum]|nr:hypothetical protein MKW92_045593 [Papaver armeniacum]
MLCSLILSPSKIQVITDGEWSPYIFNLVSWNTSRSWRSSTGSVVSHSFVLESDVKGVYHAAPAVIKFRTLTKASLQEAFPSPIPPLEILADRPPDKKFEWMLIVKSYGRDFLFFEAKCSVTEKNVVQIISGDSFQFLNSNVSRFKLPYNVKQLQFKDIDDTLNFIQLTCLVFFHLSLLAKFAQ